MFRVLIVDDDKPTVDVIRDTVDWTSLGVNGVEEAYHIDAAKELLLQKQVDIIISDIEMPRGSGLDLLEWFREQGLEGEFLLLTCHENFSYATQALHYQAADYLLKPFDAEVMEVALRKLIAQITEKRRLQQSSRWVEENRRQLQLSFWNTVLRGQFDGAPARLWSTLHQQEVAIAPTGRYALVVGRITDPEHDLERFGRRLLLFALENIHSEILCGQPENSSVVCMEYPKTLLVVTVCPPRPKAELEQRCIRLLDSYRHIMNGVLTCCLCEPCTPEEMYDTFRSAADCIAANVGCYGGWFWREEVRQPSEGQTALLDVDKMTLLLGENRKREYLEYLKANLQERQAAGLLSEQLLQEMRQEILQALYVDLAKSGIQASRVLQDDSIQSLAQKSTQSMLDMIRWATGCLNVSLDLKKQAGAEDSLDKRVDQYLEQHYPEQDLNRQRIADEFYLTPEYLGKVYKKLTGKNIKDKLAECRVTHACAQLATPSLRISDIALNVGFDNPTYFSTTFKKYTGMTPVEYRRSLFEE